MLTKIKHLLQRLAVCGKALPGDIREFGVKIAAHRLVDVLLPVGKRRSYIEALSDYMIKELESLTEKYSRGEVSAPKAKLQLDKIPVWVCWWQGEESMPPIVKACVRRMRALLPENAQLHIVTMENMGRYIDLPAHVLEKYENGQVSPAHLSDVLRFGLLSCYGGMWLDATVYLTGKLPEKLLTDGFYTQRFESWESCPQEACRGKWCGFFLGGKPGKDLFCYMYEALCFWWERHCRAADYVFFDYILWAGYCGVPSIRSAIDAVEPGNENIWLLAKHLNEAYAPEAFEALLRQNEFYKLSYKGRLEMETQDGQKTVYAHILEENG